MTKYDHTKVQRISLSLVRYAVNIALSYFSFTAAGVQKSSTSQVTVTHVFLTVLNMEDQQVSTGAAVRGKSVYILKPENVTRRDNDVYLPNLTTDMDKLRRTEQFKTGVQFDRSMSEDDVRRRLEVTFPALINKRYFCAARESQNSTRLEFYGERRVWDGTTIKRKLKGGSALYIVVEDENDISSQMPGPATVTFCGLTGAAVSENNYQSNPVENATFTDAPHDLKDINPGSLIDLKDVMDVLEEDIKNSDPMGSAGRIQEQNKTPEASGSATTTSSCSTVSDVNWTTSVNIPSQSTASNIATLTDSPLVVKDLPPGQFDFDWIKEDPSDAGCWNNDSLKWLFLGENLKSTEQIGNPITSNWLNSAENGALQTYTTTIVNQEQSEFVIQGCVGEIDDSLNTSCLDKNFLEWLSLDETSSTTEQMGSLTMTSNLSNGAKTGTIQTYRAAVVNQEQSEVLASSATTSERPESSSGISSDGNSSLPDEEIDQESAPQEIAMTMNPTSGPLEGGGSFYTELNEKLPESVTEGSASFGNKTVPVSVWRSCQGCMLRGRNIPRGDTYGTVIVTFSVNVDGKLVNLVKTDFTYVDQKKEMMKQIVSNKRRLAEFFYGVAKALKIDDNEGIETQDSEQLGLPDQLQPVDILQPLIYVAAEIGAMEFIEIIYSLSAGRIVFPAYKNDDILPEDIAEENGHEEIAAYLRDITKRFSEEDEIDQMQTRKIDWLELAKAFEENEEQSVSVGKADEIQQEREVPSNNKSCDSEDDSSSAFLPELEKTASEDEFEEMWCNQEQENEDLRMRYRRASDSSSEEIHQLRQFLNDKIDKIERVQSYVDNIPEINSIATETTDSGIQTIEPSETGTEDTSASDVTDEERLGKMNHKNSTMSKLKRANEEIMKLTSELDEAKRLITERASELDEARRRITERDKDPHKQHLYKCFAPFCKHLWNHAPQLMIIISVAVQLTVFQAFRNKENLFLILAAVLLTANLVIVALVLTSTSSSLRRKQTRYIGSWRKLFNFTFTYGCVFFVVVPILLALCYRLYDKICCLEYAILFSINCFVVPRLLVLSSAVGRNKNMADVLAWNYYFDYLKLVLPNLEGQIGKSFEYRYKITQKKLFILLPKNCYAYATIVEADPRIKCLGNLEEYNINSGGILKRSFKHTVHRIEMPRPDGGIDQYHVVLEYAHPLMSLYNMSQNAECGLSCQERDEQVLLFIRKLKEILDCSRDCRGKYELVPISGERDQIADVLVQMHHDANLTLDEGAEDEL